MFAPSQVADAQAEAPTAPAPHGSLRPSTRCTPRPPFSWLNARGTTRWPKIEVDLVGRADIESAVRSMCVVPLDEHPQLTSEVRPVVGNNELSRALLLECADETLDHGQATVLADRAESSADATPATPAPESLVGELAAVVSNEHPWSRPSLSHGSPEEGPDGLGCRLLLKHCEAHDPS